MYKTLHLANRRPSTRINDASRQQSSVFADYVAPEHALLEYGCGDGSVLDALACTKKVGVEPNAELAEIATSKGYDIRPTVCSFEGMRFDRVLVSKELGSLASHVAELHGLSDLLSPSGLLLLSQPIDADGQRFQPTEYRVQIESLKRLLTEAQYFVDSISVKRFTYRTSPFKLGEGPSPHFARKKTYWMVKPFLALVAIAHRNENADRSNHAPADSRDRIRSTGG